MSELKRLCDFTSADSQRELEQTVPAEHSPSSRAQVVHQAALGSDHRRHVNSAASSCCWGAKRISSSTAFNRLVGQLQVKRVNLGV